MEEFLESDFRFHVVFWVTYRIGDPLVHQDMAAMYLSHRRDSGSDRKAEDAKDGNGDIECFWQGSLNCPSNILSIKN